MSDTNTITIYHNPRCSKSRTALKYLEDNQEKYGYNIEEIQYQKNPPTIDQMGEIVEYLKLKDKPDSEKPWNILLRPDCRKSVSNWKDTFELLEKDINHLERPFVVDFKNKHAALGRPNLDDIEKLLCDLQ